MEVKQIYELVNGITSEVLGKEELLKEDLSNLVDVGAEVFNANAKDNYVKKLVDRIGRTIFVARKYTAKRKNIKMDSWEFGSVLQKIDMALPDATENESWELVDGTSYDNQIFYAPKVSAKYWNSKTTFEIDMSFTDRQIKESFLSVTAMNSFISMIYTKVENKFELCMENLSMRVINNFIGETLFNEYNGTGYDTKSGVRAINLLKLYNTEYGTTLTKAKALTDRDFLRFASKTISLTIDRMTNYSTLFNVGNTEKFTPKDANNLFILSDFAKASEYNMESDTYHNDIVSLKGYESVPYWQGSGTGFAFDDVSKIKVKTSEGHEVELSGIVGVALDRDAVAVANVDRRTTSSYNAKAEFYTNYAKMDAQFLNDFNENGVVFFIA